jgi:hypothetical protein
MRIRSVLTPTVLTPVLLTPALFLLLPALSVLLLSITALPSQAQPPPPRQRDTLTLAAWKAEIVRIPVLTGGSQARIIVPNREPFCFDKVVDLKLTINGHSMEQTMYLDTRGGLAGMLPPNKGAPVRDIMADQPKFSFSIMGLKGNIYNYKNSVGKHDVIEHQVFTGNTQDHQYQFASPAGSNLALSRKSETRTFCDGKLTAEAYRLDGSPNTWYVYGSRYLEKIHPIPGKYLGNFGVGYFVTEEGVYLILGRTMGAIDCRILSMDNVRKCFDPTPFQIMEDKFQAKGQADLQEERAKIDRDASKVSGNCAAEKTALLDYRREMAQQHEEALRKSKEGNTYQDPAAQKAMISLMDPLISVREGILSAKVNLCNAHDAAVTAGSPSTQAAIQQKISCLNRQLATLQDLETRMQAMDRQYTNIAQASAEKGKLYYTALKNMDNCQ